MPNQYDRIFRENIATLFPYLIKTILGLEIIESTAIRDKMQITLEREADFLEIIRDKNGKRILHIEFEGGDRPTMPARMLLYRSMLMYRYQLEVSQYVIYIGRKKSPKLYHQIKAPDLLFSYQMINIRSIDSSCFLESDTPEGVILTILSDFREHPPEEIIRMTLTRLQELIPTGIGLEKYIRQLRVLSLIRKLQSLTHQQIEKMIIDNKTFEKELKRDPLYQRGVKEGIEKGRATEKLAEQRKIVINLIVKTGFDDQVIADISETDIAFVRGIRQELQG